MDRKVLAAIAFDDPTSFGEIVKQVQAAMDAAPQNGAHQQASPHEAAPQA